MGLFYWLACDLLEQPNTKICCVLFWLGRNNAKNCQRQEYAEAVISFLPLKNRFGWIMPSMLIYLCVAKQIFGSLL